MLSLCPSCHDKVQRTQAVLSEMGHRCSWSFSENITPMKKMITLCYQDAYT